nr:immunoglobulin light chain junction region [Macaca mulatta]MOX11831.1 immunoglobulin light chain junction region [Macaca mulatta]MOX12736.1 immunoglobulin light chain junction region [Macaca mulatta]MOX13180.1 immunoglobulin light chain junction region [Macaca mulatta]MOX13264.1 immunoglobulin light chain junction region [Macaca mulatta]
DYYCQVRDNISGHPVF